MWRGRITLMLRMVKRKFEGEETRVKYTKKLKLWCVRKEKG
jgi:hypothetical protein